MHFQLFNNSVLRRIPFSVLLLLTYVTADAQVGSYRSDLAIGVNGGITFNTANFTPSVQQNAQKYPEFGVTARYVCEKYFTSICAIQLEANYVTLGWKERIRSVDGLECVNTITGLPEEYERKVAYIQIPLLAQLGWGREVNGFKFLINIGPQLGIKVSEKTVSTFDGVDPLLCEPERASQVIQQYSMPLQRGFDYGIIAGLGLEYSNRHIGHFIVEGRYYYGLGDFYQNGKTDYFSKSSYSTFFVKLTYLFDVMKTKGVKRK